MSQYHLGQRHPLLHLHQQDHLLQQVLVQSRLFVLHRLNYLYRNRLHRSVPHQAQLKVRRVDHQYHRYQYLLVYHLLRLVAHQSSYRYQSLLRQVLHLRRPFHHLKSLIQANHQGCHRFQINYQYHRRLKYHQRCLHLMLRYRDQFHRLSRHHQIGQSLAVRMNQVHHLQSLVLAYHH